MMMTLFKDLWFIFVVVYFCDFLDFNFLVFLAFLAFLAFLVFLVFLALFEEENLIWAFPFLNFNPPRLLLVVVNNICII
jgi:hypothetical protein